MRPIPSKDIKLEIEKGSLLSDLDNVGQFNPLAGDFSERKIMLLRYPVRKISQA